MYDRPRESEAEGLECAAPTLARSLRDATVSFDCRALLFADRAMPPFISFDQTAVARLAVFVKAIV